MKKCIAILLAVLLLAVTPILASANSAVASVWDGTTTDTTWYDAGKTTFEIDTAAQLAGLAELVNGGNTFANKTVKLTANVDLNNKQWTPIGYSGKTFNGVFDGGNNTVKNLSAVYELTNAAANNTIGLFGKTNDPAEIKNVTLENATVKGSLYVAAIAGYPYTGKTIANCHVKGDIKIDAWWYAGVIGGNGYINKVENCTVVGNAGSYIKGNGGSYIGGIWGFRGEGAQVIKSCSVSGVDVSGVDRVGGISGMAHYGNTIQNCEVNNLTITASDAECTSVGLIAGANNGTATQPTKIINNGAKKAFAYIADKAVTAHSGGTNENAVTEATVVGTNVVMNAAGKICGGTFEVAPPAGVLADGVTVPTADASGNYVIAISDTYAAKVNDVAYTTLQAAIDAAASGDTVTVLADIELTGKVTVAADDKIILDLAGCTVSYNPAVAGTTHALENNGDLTIEDSSAAGTGKITSSAANPDTATIPGYASNTIVNGGKLTVNGGTIECATASGGACYAIDTNWYSNSSAKAPTVIINGGTIQAKATAIRLIGYATEVSNNLQINGGEIIAAKRAIWIHLPSSTTTDAPLVNVDINGGTITAGSELALYSYSFGNAYSGVTVDISGGEITGALAFGGGSSNGGTGAEKVTVSGGTFNTNDYFDVCILSYNSTYDITVSGGVYKADIAEYLANGLYSYKITEGEHIGWYALRSHDQVVFVVAKDPTCTEKGNVAYWLCKDEGCGKFFKDEACTVELVAVEVETVAHKLSKTEAKDPTCTEKGNAEYYTCSVCKKNFDASGKELTTVETQAIGHKLTKVEAKTATYTSAGNVEHYICSACGKLFLDAEGKKETTAADVVIAQLVKVEEEKAEITEGAVDSAIDEAAKGETATDIVLDMNEIAKENASEGEKPAEIVSVELPVASLEKVADLHEDATLTIVLKDVTVVLDTTTLEAIANQAEGETVTLNVGNIKTTDLNEKQQAALKDVNVAGTISAQILCNGTDGKIADFNGGNVTVKIPFTPVEGTKGTDYVVVYIADDGTMEEVATTFVDGSLVVTLEHFSEYVIVNNAAQDEEGSTPDTGDAVMLAPVAVLLALSMAGGAVIAAGKKKFEI